MSEIVYRHHFTIEGKVKPYVRMTQRGKWTRPEAQEYLNSRRAIATQFIQQMQAYGAVKFPRRTPLAIELRFYHAGGFHNKDLDNQVKAVLDAMQGIVIHDDRWIDEIVATRRNGRREGVEIFWIGELDHKEEGED